MKESENTKCLKMAFNKCFTFYIQPGFVVFLLVSFCLMNFIIKPKKIGSKISLKTFILLVAPTFLIINRTRLYATKCEIYLLQNQPFLLQNTAAFLLQNEPMIYYKTRQLFYYKTSCFYYKTRQLLQNQPFITKLGTTMTQNGLER